MKLFFGFMVVAITIIALRAKPLRDWEIKS